MLRVSQLPVNGKRKYTVILEKLVAEAVCKVSCSLADTRTIIDGVKKEKVKWVKLAKRSIGVGWPKGQALTIDINSNEGEEGITFRRVLDTSTRNL